MLFFASLCGADLRLAVQVQEGLELDEEDSLPLCAASPDQGEEQVHLPMLQGEPQAPPPLSQDPQEECQLEVKSFFFLHAQKDEKNYYYLLQL